MQILTLAKQMYPGKTDFFFNQYEEAVERPFGYLLIDVKATTQDNCRKRTNVLYSEEGRVSRKYSSRASEISKAAKSFACPASSSYARDAGENGRSTFSKRSSGR